MGELVEKIRYEIDESDVVRGQDRMKRSADETARENEEAAKKADGAWSRFASGLERNAGKMRAVGAGMTVALTAPLVAFGNASINAASDHVESASKSQAVFGEWADDIEAWSRTASESLRMGRTEALEAAGTFGNLFTAMGTSREAAAEMSTEVVQLAADLASFNNIGADEALEKLRSGLVGEIEPLRQLGVSFNAAAVEAKALEMGLADANGEVGEAEKVQARLALVLEMTTNAQGDAAKTAGTLVGQQAELDAKSQELQETIGARLVPAKLALVEAANGVLSSFMALPGPAQDVAVGVGAITAAAGPSLMALGQMSMGIGAVREALPGLRSRMSSVVSLLTGPWGVAITGATLAVGVWAAAKRDAEQRVRELTDAIKADSGALSENTRATVVNRLEREGILKAAEELGVSLRDVTDAVMGDDAALQRISRTAREANDEFARFAEDGTWHVDNSMRDAAVAGDQMDQSVKRLTGDIETAQEEFRRTAEAMGETEDAAGPAAAALGTLADRSGFAAGQVRTLKDALDAQRAATMALADPLFAAISSEQSLTEARAAAAAAAKEHGESSDEATTAMLEAARAALVFDGDLAALLESVRNGDGDVGTLRAAMQRLHDQDMVDEDALAAIQAELEQMLELAERINGTEAVLRVRTVYQDAESGRIVGQGLGRGGIIEGSRALGGPVRDGRPYLVGEEGPEIFVPDGAGTIIPNDRSMRYLERIMMATERSASRGPLMPFAVDGSEDSMATLRLIEMASD